jgi:hypothetical protein
MCRAGIEARGEQALAHLLQDIVQVIVDQANIDVNGIRIGPIDLGSPDDHRSTA